MWVGVWCWQIVKDTLLDCSQHRYIVILMFSRSKTSFAYCRPNAFQFKGFVKKEDKMELGTESEESHVVVPKWKKTPKKGGVN